MIRLRSRRGRPVATEDEHDSKHAIGHLLALLERVSRIDAVGGLDEGEVRSLRLRALRATNADEISELAMEIQSLRVRLSHESSAAGDPLAKNGPVGIIADAAESALGVALATGAPALDKGLDVLRASPRPDPRPEPCEAFGLEMERLAFAVLFLRQRGDVMHTSINELAHLLASLSNPEPAALVRLEEAHAELASANSLGELERLRESLMGEASRLVSETRARVQRAGEAGELLRHTQAHQRILELALDNANTMAETDALTGLGNRRALDRAVTQLAKQGHDVGVATLDLDHFKRVNDTHGHDAGDAVLKSAAAVLRAELRGADRAFRSGGEEFIFLLPQTTFDGAVRTAERVRGAIENLLIQHDSGGPALRVTGSFGVAVWGGRSDYVSAARRSDAALYEAKRQGRNRVVGRIGSMAPSSAP
ncbi:MAG: diguanylate cyclase (GGDEF)-like protein [Polyangiales bacterium]|jgi:diguanylate cyclase (GGDEF)-like protein